MLYDFFIIFAGSNPHLALHQQKSHPKVACLVGELGGIRTHDPLIKSQMLYRLSYELIKTGMLIDNKN